MADTDLHFRGGAYTSFGEGTAATDGDFEFEGNTYAISAVADAGGGDVRFTVADHGDDITVGSKVTVSGTTHYDGTHLVTDVTDTTHFDVTETWNINRTGNAKAHRTSNWVDENGIGTHMPVTATDKVHLTELAGRVPSTYSNSAYPHTAGGHWCITDNLDQSALDLNGFFVSAGYEGHVYGYNSDTLDAAAAVDKGSDQVGIPCTGHPFTAGDYVTLGGTVNYKGEYRVVSKTANEFVIDHVYYVETFEVADTATGRTPLQISIADTYDMIIESNGTFYIECGSTTPNIPELIFNSTSGLLHISSEAANANWDDIQVKGGGTLNIAPDTYFTKLTTTGEATGATVIVGTGCIGPAAASCDIDCHAATITWDSKIGDVILNGGMSLTVKTLARGQLLM